MERSPFLGIAVENAVRASETSDKHLALGKVGHGGFGTHKVLSERSYSDTSEECSGSNHTRQISFPPSSEISRAPSAATATPTMRP